MTVVLSALELCVIADYCTMEKHLRVRFYTLKKRLATLNILGLVSKSK